MNAKKIKFYMIELTPIFLIWRCFPKTLQDVSNGNKDAHEIYHCIPRVLLIVLSSGGKLELLLMFSAWSTTTMITLQ